MPIDKAWNAYIFRDGKTTASGPALLRDFVDGLHAYDASPSKTALTDLLLRAGELECALRDVNSAHGPLIESITEAIAEAFVSGTPLPTNHLLLLARSIVVPGQVSIAPPEGFAFYSLHPLDFASLVRRVPKRSPTAVIGIRSIGTTLSAIVKAVITADGRYVERITVRPTGHPYDRRTHFSPEEKQWIDLMLSRRADFLVVDEGPGMSGSSFLSIGDALITLGVPLPQIRFLGTRTPDASALTAPNAAERWSRFNADYTEPIRHLPTRAKQYVAGGIWRAKVFASEADWPASWRQMERLKFQSEDDSLLFRFEGFGRFGEAVYQRAVKIAEAGFGPMPLPREEGFGVYPMISGRHLSAADATPPVLSRLADYCAFRPQKLPSEVTHTPELETMLLFNTVEEFATEVPVELSALPIERPVIADGRMLPYKWISTGDTILKIDAATHGDDHFFPGPTDIAWDLAGAIVEWNLDAESAAFFVDCYRQRSGDDPARRLPAYLLAYSIFRTAYCKMAAVASNGTVECSRFLCDLERYRRQAKDSLLNVPRQGAGNLETVDTQAA
jgi:hypothetical protein